MNSQQAPLPMPQTIATQESRKRKRPRVPLEQRQRAPVACAPCRRLKEKCDGNIPCQRCKRYKRECCAVARPADAEANLIRDDQTPSVERIQDLEYIARLSDEHLRRIVLDHEAEPSKAGTPASSYDVDELALDQELFTVKTLSRSVAHYSGELSHWNFSQKVREQVDKRLKDAAPGSTHDQPDTILEYWRANHLQSRSSRSFVIRNLIDSLPPKHVALFLASVYFKYAQTNTFFVEKDWILGRLDALYSTSEDLCGDDAAWLCTTLGVLAVGTSFVEMEEASTQPICLEDNSGRPAAAAAGVSFYQIATGLIPDVMHSASVESVQAFLLLAHYALPLDTGGLAYTYLGLALKMAVQNGMHRRHSGDLDSETVDLRSRLWWTAYRLEKRVSILHGRPASISFNEIDAEYPSDRTPGTSHQSRVLENGMTQITNWLGDIAVIIHMLRRSPKRLRRAYFDRLMQVRQQYMQWWQHTNIPASTTDSRAVAHIHMSHHLNLIFLGRPFMFQPQRPVDQAESTGTACDVAESPRNRIAELVQDAVNSAEQIVNIASHLHNGAGLARASYVEFSSCRAAMLVLLAQCLNEPCRKIRAKLAEGMKLIQHMAPANASTKSEASVMAAIESAIKRLDSELLARSDNSGTHDSFSSFMRWASGFQSEENNIAPPVAADNGDHESSARPADIKETFVEVGWSPLDFSILDGEPGSSTGLDSYHFDEAFSIYDESVPWQ